MDGKYRVPTHVYSVCKVIQRRERVFEIRAKEKEK